MPNEGDRIELVKMKRVKGYDKLPPGRTGTVLWCTENIVYVDWDNTHDKVSLINDLDKWKII